MDKIKFGLYLKEIRKKRGLTIHQVETYAGVSNSYISLLERGKRDIPSPAILKKLAPLYKVPYRELMEKAGYTEEETIINEGISHEVGVKLVNDKDLEKYVAIIEKAKSAKISPERLDKLIDVLINDK